MCFEASKLIWSVLDDSGKTISLALDPTQFLLGPFVIFIAWIMDEGRKIQEEQELTV
jgi:hypothetical protein